MPDGVELGPGDYAVLLCLRNRGLQLGRVLNDRFLLEDGTEFANPVVHYLQISELVSIASRSAPQDSRIGDWSSFIEITCYGDQALDAAIEEPWTYIAGGICEPAPAYWYEARDRLTGRLFVVRVFDALGQERTSELARLVAQDGAAREAARGIEQLGPDHSISWVEKTATIWRKR